MIHKVKKISLSDQLIESITENIEKGDWEAGYKLPNEIELSAAFNVSRNVMREALKILGNYGIITSRAGVGTIVTEDAQIKIGNMRFFKELNENPNVASIMDSRWMLEPRLAYFAAKRRSEEDCEVLRTYSKRIEATLASGNPEMLQDFNFHMLVAGMARNSTLEKFLAALLQGLKESEYDKINHYIATHGTESLQQHRLISQAIIDGDAELAQSMMANHLYSRIEEINYKGITKGRLTE